MATNKEASEFGGKPGLIQSEADGHQLEPHEVRMLVTQTDENDPTSGAGLPSTPAG
jgi:hypothetical protein